MTNLPPPGNYWLITASGKRRKAIVTEDLLLIWQESDYDFGDYNGERWWQPPKIHEWWNFVQRV